MPIKAADLTAKEFRFTDFDPDDKTWVKVKPHSWQDDLERGEFLRTRNYTSTNAVGTDVNNYALMQLEIWLTYEDSCIEVELPDGKTARLFKPRKDMSRSEFFEALADPRLPPRFILAWHTFVIQMNGDWRLPF
jgi:hypothetical protein